MTTTTKTQIARNAHAVTAAEAEAAEMVETARKMGCGFRVTHADAEGIAAALLRFADADGGQIDDGRWDISGDDWRIDLRSI